MRDVADDGDRTGGQQTAQARLVGQALALRGGFHQRGSRARVEIEVDRQGTDAVGPVAVHRDAESDEHAEHVAVVALGHGAQAADPGAFGRDHQVLGEQRGDALALQRVGDRERDLGLVALLPGPAVPVRESDDLAVQHGEQPAVRGRAVFGLRGADEVGEDHPRIAGRAEEAAVGAVRTEGRGEIVHRPPVGRGRGAQPDGAPVGQQRVRVGPVDRRHSPSITSPLVIKSVRYACRLRAYRTEPRALG